MSGEIATTVVAMKASWGPGSQILLFLHPIVVLPCYQLLYAMRNTPCTWMKFLSRRNLSHHSYNCAVHCRYITVLIRGWSTAYCSAAACSNAAGSTATCWSVLDRRTAPYTGICPFQFWGFLQLMRTARMIGRCVATGDADASFPTLTTPLGRPTGLVPWCN